MPRNFRYNYNNVDMHIRITDEERDLIHRIAVVECKRSDAEVLRDALWYFAQNRHPSLIDDVKANRPPQRTSPQSAESSGTTEPEPTKLFDPSIETTTVDKVFGLRVTRKRATIDEIRFMINGKMDYLGRAYTTIEEARERYGETFEITDEDWNAAQGNGLDKLHLV